MHVMKLKGLTTLAPLGGAPAVPHHFCFSASCMAFMGSPSWEDS